MSKLPSTKERMLKKYPAITDLKSVDIQPIGTVKGDAFFGSSFEFILKDKINSWFVPNDVRIRMRFAINVTGSAAFAMNPAANFIERETLMVEGKELEKINNYNNIINTMDKRVMKSGGITNTNEQYMKADISERGKMLDLYSLDYVNKNLLSIIYNANDKVAVSDEGYVTFVLDIDGDCTEKYSRLLNKYVYIDADNKGILKIKYSSTGDPIFYLPTTGHAKAATTIDDATMYFKEIKEFYEGNEGSNYYTFYYKPTLSFFNIKTPVYLGSKGYSYTLEATTLSDLKKNLIQTMASLKTGIGSEAITITCEDIRLQYRNYVGRSPNPNEVFNYALMPKTCQIKTFSGKEINGESQRSITLNKGCKALCIGFRSSKRDNFECSTILDDNVYSVKNFLSKLSIDLGGTKIPRDEYKFNLTSTGKFDSLRKLYIANQEYQHKMGGEFSETYKEFLERGIYMFVNFGVDLQSKTNLTIEYEFDGEYTQYPLEVVCISYAKATLSVKPVNNGAIYSVKNI